MGTIGGLVVFLSGILSIFVPTLSEMRLSAILSAKFYTWDPTDAFKESCCTSKVKKGPIRINPADSAPPRDIVESTYVREPACMHIQKVLCCCSQWYKDYRVAVKAVEVDLHHNLDVVSMMRRLQMHGLALTALTNRPARFIISE